MLRVCVTFIFHSRKFSFYPFKVNFPSVARVILIIHIINLHALQTLMDFDFGNAMCSYVYHGLKKSPYSASSSRSQRHRKTKNHIFASICVHTGNGKSFVNRSIFASKVCRLSYAENSPPESHFRHIYSSAADDDEKIG